MSGGIDRISRRTPGASSGKSGAASSPGEHSFDTLLQPGARPLAAKDTDAPAAAANLTAIQAELGDVLAGRTRDREARRQGKAMLKALASLQRALLGSDPSQTRQALLGLADAIQESQPADDPVLHVILRDIAVRAAVELARGDVAPP